MATKPKNEYPLIGYEYEYLGQPVRVLRVLPTNSDAHVEFETRFADRSSCDAGELGKWQDTEKKPTKAQAQRIRDDLESAIKGATTRNEKLLIRHQFRRLNMAEQ